MNSLDIRVVDFSQTPGGRYIDQGPDSGELFRQVVLVPALREHQHVKVYLDGTSGYGSSFLEEAFGGLVRVEGFTKSELKSKLEILAGGGYRFYREKALGFIAKAVKKVGS